MFLASVVLALLVGAGLRGADPRGLGAARGDEARRARSKDVTAAALRLEKLVFDMETGVRGFTVTRRRRSTWSPTRTASAVPAIECSRAARQGRPAQRATGELVENQIREYSTSSTPSLTSSARSRDRRWTTSISWLQKARPVHRRDPQALQRLPRGGEQARRWPRRPTPTVAADLAVLVGAVGRRRLDGADRALRDLPRALDRPPGARGRRRREPHRRRRVVAPPARGGPGRDR